MGLVDDLHVLCLDLGIESLDSFVLLCLLGLILLDSPFMLSNHLLTVFIVCCQVLQLVIELLVLLNLLIEFTRLVK